MAGNVLNKIVVGLMGGSAYGFPVARVESLIRVPEITPVPGMPDFVEGVMNLRGLILPVIDLRRRFSLPAVMEDRTRILVADIGQCAAGLIVDSVNEVIDLPPENIEPVPPAIAAQGRGRFSGIGKAGNRLILLVDLANLLSAEESGAVSTAMDNRQGT